MRLTHSLRALALCGAPLLASCFAARVNVDRDSAVPLPVGATWAWRSHDDPDAQNEQANALTDNPIVHQRLKRLFATELAAHGFQQVDEGAASTLLVDYHLGITEQRETVRSVGPNTGRWVPQRTCDRSGNCTTRTVWGPFGPPEVTYRTLTYHQGTVVLDVADRASGQVAWRAVGNQRVTPTTESEKSLQRLVKRLLRDFPGASGH